MECYCYTVTVSPRIAREFQVNDYDRTNSVFFCGSKFTDKESCISFAEDIERMKAEIQETNWTIYAGKSKRFIWLNL